MLTTENILHMLKYAKKNPVKFACDKLDLKCVFAANSGENIDVWFLKLSNIDFFL